MAVCSNFPINGSATQTVTIGQGGEGNLSNGGNNYSLNGTPSYFGPGPVPAGVTGLGGGWGGGDQGPRGVDGGGGASQSPGPVGSGGGGGDLFNGNPDGGYGGNAQQPGQTQVANTTNYGNAGGHGSGSPNVNYRRGGGGGGAGASGTQGSSDSNSTVAHGGYGRQLPTTFHDPNSTVGEHQDQHHLIHLDSLPVVNTGYVVVAVVVVLIQLQPQERVVDQEHPLLDGKRRKTRYE